MIVNELVEETQLKSKYVMILGGSNFMGKDLLDVLVSRNSGYKVFIINRNKLHWNNEASAYYEHPNVKHYFGDRDSHIEFTKLLKYLTQRVKKETSNPDFKWDLVIDFCGYLRKEVKSVIRGLTNDLRLYVFISTDSIYDVCETSGLSCPVREEEAIRPTDNKKIADKAEDEEYGHDKLKCEEYLRSHCSDLKSGFPYICLRLPDVIGPYDSTGRFWTYMLWIQKMAMWPVHSKREAEEKPLSFVFSKDVTRLVVSLLGKIGDKAFISKIHSESFNIGFEENPTLNQFLQLIADAIKGGKILFVNEKDLPKICKPDVNKGKYFYPSVYCPHLNIEKAKEVLGWNSTDLKAAVQETAMFFVTADKYLPEMKKVVQKIAKIQEYYSPEAVQNQGTEK